MQAIKKEVLGEDSEEDSDEGDDDEDDDEDDDSDGEGAGQQLPAGAPTQRIQVWLVHNQPRCITAAAI